MIYLWFPWVWWLLRQVLAKLPQGTPWSEIASGRVVKRPASQPLLAEHMVLVHVSSTRFCNLNRGASQRRGFSLSIFYLVVIQEQKTAAP